MTVQDAIRQLVQRQELSEPQAFDVATEIMRGEVTPAQIGALLVALRVKGETVEELTGFVRATRSAATPLPIDGDDLVDTCGTGGDGQGTFNVSTVCAFVAAGAGCKVAKHGNRSISSRCGSADVLAELGVEIEVPPEKFVRCINEIGVGFLFAPYYHKSMKHAAGPRREIGVRSIFNLIGPLVHPAGAKRQMLGVFDGNRTEVLARVLGRLGSIHCLVVHGEDGLDEITLSGPTRVSELRDGEVQNYTVSPEQFGFERAELDSLRGGDAVINARIAERVLSGEKGPARDIVLLNAGGAIYVGGRSASLEEGIKLAAESIDQGKAAAKLAALRGFSRET